MTSFPIRFVPDYCLISFMERSGGPSPTFKTLEHYGFSLYAARPEIRLGYHEILKLDVQVTDYWKPIVTECYINIREPFARDYVTYRFFVKFNRSDTPLLLSRTLNSQIEQRRKNFIDLIKPFKSQIQNNLRKNPDFTVAVVVDVEGEHLDDPSAIAAAYRRMTNMQGGMLPDSCPWLQFHVGTLDPMQKWG